MNKIEITDKKKPDFVRQGYRRKSVKRNWRRPKGRHSKTRRGFRGKVNLPQVGYRGPRINRRIKFIIINNVNELKDVKMPIMLGGNVGQRKRVEIIKKAIEKNIKILNIRNPVLYLKEVTESLNSRKEKTETTPKPKEMVVEPKKTEVSEEEKKKQESEMKRKVLEGK